MHGDGCWDGQLGLVQRVEELDGLVIDLMGEVADLYHDLDGIALLQVSVNIVLRSRSVPGSQDNEQQDADCQAGWVELSHSHS